MQQLEFLGRLVSVSNWFQIHINFDSCVVLGLMMKWKVTSPLSSLFVQPLHLSHFCHHCSRRRTEDLLPSSSLKRPHNCSQAFSANWRGCLMSPLG